MAVVERKRKSGPAMYYVVLAWQGKRLWKRVGTHKAEALAKERTWKEQISSGLFSPDDALPASPTLGEYAPVWLGKRTNRTAENDAALVRDHVLAHPIAAVRLSDVRPRHVLELVNQLRPKGIADKTIANVLGVLRVLFRDAQIAELVYTQPVLLPKKTLNRRRKKDPEIYQPTECLALMTNVQLDPRTRMLWAMALCTGMRLGEVVGRRWRDAKGADGLDVLHVATQYGGAPLKTDNPRVVPIHPVLSLALESWVDAWEAIVGRKPGPDDFIIPDLDGTHLTRSQVYKMLRSSCQALGIAFRSVHSTRHTMITLCRRGGADEDSLERVTHNARGGIVDGYTRQDWEPLCRAVKCLSFDADLRIALPSGNQGKNRFLPGVVEAPVSSNRGIIDQEERGSIPGASTSGSGNSSRSNVAGQHTVYAAESVGSIRPVALLALASAAEAALARRELRRRAA